MTTRYLLLALDITDHHEDDASPAAIRDALFLGTPFALSEMELADVTADLRAEATTAIYEMKRRLA